MHLLASSDQGEAIRAAARDWIFAVSEDPAREADCLAWRTADPLHEAAWQDVSRVWLQSAELASLNRADWRAQIDAMAGPASYRGRVWAIAASVAVIIGGTFYARSLPDLQAETAVAEIRKLALVDGSHVTLSGQSALAVRFENGSRRVVLDHGQVFFEIAHDRQRPFTVVAGNAEIRVTGTKFDVRKVGDDVRVTVLIGRVELRKAAMLPILTSERPDRVLTAGLRSELAPGAAHFSPETHTPIPAGDWRSGRLFYKEAPLSEIVADLQRYSMSPIRVEDPVVARLRVTTSFRASQITPFLESLPATLPVRLFRTADGAVLIESRRREL